jgi:hypothetical protein
MTTVDWERLEKELTNKRGVREKVKEKLREIYGQVTNREVKSRIIGLIEAWKHGKYPTNLYKIRNEVIPNIRKKNELTASIFEILIEAIEHESDKYGFTEVTEEITEEERVEIEVASEQLSGIIGRVAITKNTPATPYSFYFWLTRDPSIHVEPGEFIVIPKVALAVVEDIQSTTDIPDSVTHHFSWSFGSPEEKMPTEIPIIRTGKANIVYRTDGLNAPFTSAYPIMKSEANHLRSIFEEMIPDEEKRLLLGFIKDGYGVYVPVFGAFNYIFGYEAGHVNITGKSGVAGKTTYALFLIASALSYSRAEDNQSEERTLGLIAFNVKERDLLTVSDFPYESLDEAIEDLRSKGYEDSADMWEKAKEIGVDPVEIFKDAVFWGLGHNQKNFSYGLQDILERGIYTFISLFSPEDIDDKMESLIYSIIEEFSNERSSFSSLISDLQRRLSGSASGRSSQNVIIGRAPHHPQTVNKFLNRLNRILNSSKVIDKENPYGNPIKVHGKDQGLSQGELWIIDIKPLRDFEQRMIFFSILSDLEKLLEAKRDNKEGIKIRGEYLGLKDFPSRVCVFVDELNKFAPSSKRAFSSIKTFIIDIASRGRSIGLTLLGAEQFASEIDEEVLGNTSTYLVGKSEEFELSNKFYKRIPEGLRRRIPYLKAGELVLVHEAHNTPFIINYPIRLDKVR